MAQTKGPGFHALHALLVVACCMLPGTVVRPPGIDGGDVVAAVRGGEQGQLQVRVVRRGVETAVARATVRLLSVLVPSEADDASASEDARVTAAGTCTTDASGTCVLGTPGGGDYWVLASGYGLARASSHLTLGREKREVTLTLEDNRVLDVHVKNEAGDPVPGASVEVQGGDPLPLGARTRPDGHAHVEGLAQGPYNLSVFAPGFEGQTRRGVRQSEHVVVTLKKLGALSLQVEMADGTPAVGAKVSIAGAEMWPARTARTDKKGHLRLAGLSEGTYALRAVLGDQVSAVELSPPVLRGEDVALVLRMVPGEWVPVHVTEDDGEESRPVALAQVTLAEQGLSALPFEARTDEHGHARLGPVPPGELFVSARAEGFVPSEPVDVLRPLQAPVSLVLTKGGTLEGRVVDARGFPIYGVTLEVVGTSLQGAPIADDPRRHAAQASQFERVFSGPKPLMGAGELGVVPGPVPAIPKAFAATKWVSVGATKVAIPVDPWVTRSDGTFRAEPVTPGRVRVVAHHPLFVEGFSELLTLLPGARREVNLVLHAGGFLEGRVVDSTGRAVPGARVVVAAIRGAFERMTSAASDGTFAFAAVPDAVSVLVTAQGENETLMSARIDVTVPEGGRRKVSLTLPPPRGVLNLRAKDERGSNLDNVQVRAMSLDPASPYRVTAFSNKDGEIRLLGAKGLPLRLECSAPHHAPKTVKVLPSADLVNIVLGPSEVLKGHVRTARVGEPISGAEVTVVAGVAPRRVVSGADGTFRADDLPPGPVELRVRAPGFAPTSVSLRTTEGRRRDGLVVVELGPEAVVEGTVVDSRGTPVAGARVARDHVPTYVPAGALPAEVAVTDRDGHFVLRELPEGSLHLEAFAADVGRGSLAEVRTVAGRTRSGVTILLKNEALADGRDALSSGGVAITLGERAGDVPEVVIASVSAQSEAERAGLRAGDVLVAIDGENVEGMEKARQRLSGPLGDDVILTVRRPDTEQSFRVPRERVNR